MKRVLIISPSLQEQKLIEEVALDHKERGDFEFQTTSSFGQPSSWWSESKIDLALIALPDDELLQISYFNKLKQDIPRSMPLILVTANISQSLLQLTQIFAKVRILKAPATGFFMYRAVLDITTQWAPGKQQVHPRYMTEQEVKIRREGFFEEATAMLKNISVGGAYFETDDAVLGLKPTDVIQIAIELPDLPPYEFEARIVWSKPQGKRGTVGYGVTFTDMDEVYQNLLKGL